MKRFRNITQDTKAPSTSGLWINNGELKYYTSNGSSDVYVLLGNLQTTEGWSTTDVESIVGNCYCHYSSYNADGTANGGCFTTIKKQSSGQYLVDYIKV